MREPFGKFFADRGTHLAAMIAYFVLVSMFVGLLAGSIGYDLLKAHAQGVIGNPVVAYAVSLVVSAAFVFLFLFSAYYRLTNAALTAREVLPGALVGTVALETTFQV